MTDTTTMTVYTVTALEGVTIAVADEHGRKFVFDSDGNHVVGNLAYNIRDTFCRNWPDLTVGTRFTLDTRQVGDGGSPSIVSQVQQGKSCEPDGVEQTRAGRAIAAAIEAAYRDALDGNRPDLCAIAGRALRRDMTRAEQEKARLARELDALAQAQADLADCYQCEELAQAQADIAAVAQTGMVKANFELRAAQAATATASLRVTVAEREVTPRFPIRFNQLERARFWLHRAAQADARRSHRAQ